jgi:phytanoyl-CoA hydroxylase
MTPSRSESLAASPGAPALSGEERAAFDRDGLLILRGWSPASVVAAARSAAEQQLAERRAPMELEVDVGYPGAPASKSTPGAETVRRLLRAYDRGEAFRTLAASPALGRVLRELIGGEILLAQAHHNCVMTKMPSFSSLTNWHQDVRYWSYQRPELVSAWFALGAETEENGCLSFIPGTHRMNFPRDRLDDQLFLSTDRPDNQALIASAVTPALAAGDLVLFHCRLFHAAGRNRTSATKFSLVCTYRAADNLPLPGTKSASVGDVAV